MNQNKRGKKRLIAALAVLVSAVSLPWSMLPVQAAADYSQEGEAVYEAEDAAAENVEVVQEFYDGGNVADYSGTGFVGQFDNTDDAISTLTFTIEIPEDGKYDLLFMTCSPFDEKKNDIKIDDGEAQHEALVSPKGQSFQKVKYEATLTAGTHTVSVIEGWGFMYLDALVVKKQVPAIPELKAEAAPVNPNATTETKALMDYLNESYGKVILAGQYAEGIDAPEIQAIYDQTGKYPAVMGFDFLYTGKTAKENVDFEVNTTQLAIDWWNKGGIVTFCWHWFAPKDNLLTDDQPWNKSFYSKATDFDFHKAITGEDQEGYDMLIADIDAVSAELKKLQDAGVPVIWRPLHEASGGWFWWGEAGSEDYKALWNLMYDRMVNVNGLNNLIWVWNGQHNDTDPLNKWYPGDKTVDIIGEDIYADKQDYSSQVDRFVQATKYTRTGKIIALSETGVIPDPDELFKDGNIWSFFAPWYREFVVDMDYGYEKAGYSDEYTGIKMLRKVYNHEKVITLDELPLLNANAEKPAAQEEGADSTALLTASFVICGIFAVTTVIFLILFLKAKKKRISTTSVN